MNTVYLMVLPIVLLTTFPFVHATSHSPAYDHGYQAGYDNETTASACVMYQGDTTKWNDCDNGLDDGGRALMKTTPEYAYAAHQARFA
jgi:hypothetical protein